MLVVALLLGVASTALALTVRDQSGPKPPPVSGPPKPPPPPSTQPQSSPQPPTKPSSGKPPGNPDKPGTVRRAAASPSASAIDYSSSCFANMMPANDDGTAPSGARNQGSPIDIGFQISFFGSTYLIPGTSDTGVYINNNGDVTFDGPLSDYTPFSLYTTHHPIIAAGFGDVDTRGAGSGLVHWGSTTFDGHQAFCVTWGDRDGTGVGYYDSHVDKLNSFQLLIVDRSDAGPGQFDLVYNYDQVQWEAGDVSGGSAGICRAGVSPCGLAVGYSNGTQQFSYELPGSHVPGAFIDGGPSSLTGHSKNSSVQGQYILTGPATVGVPVVTVVSAVPDTIGPGGSSTITWNATLDGTYSVRVGGTDCTSGNQVANGSYTASTGNATTDVAASDLSVGANTIRVCVTNVNGTGSDTTTVTLQAPPPDAPTLTSPSDGQTITDSTPTLAWSDESGSGATTYDVEYVSGQGCDFTHPTIVSQLETDSYTFGDALADGTYCWRAQADGAGGSSGYSDAFTFTVDTTAPSVPSPTSPADGSTVATGSPTLQWSEPDESAATFDVQWGPQGNCTATTDSGLTATSDPLSELADGTYCWRVRAVDAAGNASDYSSTFTFTVLTVPPSVSASASPATIGAGGSSTITWSASQNGSFSVRVGGTDCTSGTQVDSGSYTTSPADRTSTVTASELAEGENTVRVCVTNAASLTGSGSTTVTKDTTPPAAPSPTSPADGSTVATGSPTLQWSDADESAATYDVQWGPQGSCTATTDSGLTATSDPLSGLADGTYCWQVRAVDALGNASDYSATFTFTVDTTAPAVPTPTSPADASTITTPSPTLQWTESDPSAATYDVQWGPQGNCTATTDAGLTAASDPLSDLADGTYCWQVRARDAAGNASDWSPTFTFTVDTTPPAVPSPTSPPDGSTVNTSSPTLQWSEPDESAATYDVQWGSNAGGCSFTTTDSGLTSTSDGLTGLADGAYCWHVRARDAAGNASDWSSTFTFTVETTPVVTIDSTNPTTIGKSGTSTITWHANQDGSFTVRAGGTSCSDGTIVLDGPYTGSPAVVTTDVPASDLSAGPNTVRVCVTSAGGTGFATTTVTLEASSPQFTDVPAPIVVQASSADGAVVTYTTPNVFDPDSQVGPVTCSPPSGSVFPIGTTTVTCSATDVYGNKGTAKFDVTVQDTTPPDLTVPADFTVETPAPVGAVVTYTVSATDAVDPNPSISCSPASGTTFPVGATTVTCTATDASGNSASKSFVVTVTFSPTAPPPGQVAAQPVPGKKNAKVKLPGTDQFVDLSQVSNLPPGTEIDVSGQAALGLTDPAGNVMYFFGVAGNVPSTFVFKGVTNGIVQLTLSDVVGVRHFSAADLEAKPKPKKKENPVARLWGSGKGRFTTTGKYASATVRGTIWVVADYKDFTRVTVKRGLVAVRNLVTKKTVLVSAGHSVIVRKATKAKPAKKKSTPKKPKKHKKK